MLDNLPDHTPVLRYASGQFHPMPPAGLPAPFRPALEPDHDDLDFRLSGAGCTCVESYGDSLGLDVWMHPAGWLVIYYTDAAPCCLIHVESVADMLELEGRFLAPTACKIMAEHAHFQAMKVQRQRVREAA